MNLIRNRRGNAELVGGMAIVVIIIGLLSFGLWGWPKYKAYQRELNGRAQLKEAEWNRKILIEEAEAKEQAAERLAEAEIARARGVAEANKIIGASLKNNKEYLRFADSGGEPIPDLNPKAVRSGGVAHS